MRSLPIFRPIRPLFSCCRLLHNLDDRIHQLMRRVLVLRLRLPPEIVLHPARQERELYPQHQAQAFAELVIHRRGTYDEHHE
jgi:hypothetical protein